MFKAARPRRSVLFVPGSNSKALAKSTTLAADSIIIDLEDAVAPESKATARSMVADALATRSLFGKRELIIRVNGLNSDWGVTDLEYLRRLEVDAVLLPKVEHASAIDAALAYLVSDTAIWCMIETPRGVMHAEEIANHPNVNCLVLGTSDLTKDLRAQHTQDRLPLLASLSFCLLAARAAEINIVDGVHLDLDDHPGLVTSCQQGLELGFDGKTLIHPKQISVANEIFSPSIEQLKWSHKIIEAFETSNREGHGVTVVNGKLVENLHIAEARRLIDLYDLINELVN